MGAQRRVHFKSALPEGKSLNYTVKNEWEHSWRINKQCRVRTVFLVFGPLEKPSPNTSQLQCDKMVVKVWVSGRRSSILKVPIYKSPMLFCLSPLLLSYASFLLLSAKTPVIWGRAAKTEAKATLRFTEKAVKGHFCWWTCMYEFLNL